MTEDTERAGLGKIIYSVDKSQVEKPPETQQAENAEVAEAVEESFPASDPPGFSGGSASDPS